MDHLPPDLLLSILTRLTDSTDITRCKLVSKTFNSLSQDLKFINLQCPVARYLKSRSPSTKSKTTPFKQIILNLVKNHPNIESVSIGVDKSLKEISYDDVEDDDDDLYLNDVEFVKEWLMSVCDGLKSISVSDFWVQSCWRKSGVLSLISSCCHRLVELQLKNAWLSVDGLNPVPSLKRLTLEFVRLDDEDLDKVNECFPSLQVLNLIGVGGLKEPKIHLLQLNECQWTVSNAPHSLAILAPSLIKLKLNCSKPRSLVIKTPLLSEFHLSLETVGKFSVEGFPNLETFKLESPNLAGFIYKMPTETVNYLAVDLLKCEVETRKLDPKMLFDAFPNLNSLKVGPGAWFALETWHKMDSLSTNSRRGIGVNQFKEIVARIVVYDVEITYSFISYILCECTNLSYATFLIHRHVGPTIAYDLISRCVVNYPRVKWKWGTWKEEEKDVWVSAYNLQVEIV